MTSASKNFLVPFFLLALAISSNFLPETLSCDIRVVLANSIVVKQLLVLCLLIFTIDFAESEDTPLKPSERLRKAFAVWILFLMFGKLKFVFASSAFFFVLVIAFMNFQTDYDKQMHPEKEDAYKSQKNLCFNAFIAIVISGFLYYCYDVSRKHGIKAFDPIHFIFGLVKDCQKGDWKNMATPTQYTTAAGSLLI